MGTRRDLPESTTTYSSDMESTTAVVVDPEEWEEWDGNSPFWVHCVAGSLAGVAEHTLVYPLDTVRTHIQVCAACHTTPVSMAKQNLSVLQKAASIARPQQVAAQTGMLATMRQLMSQPVALEAAASAAASATSTTTTSTTTSVAATSTAGFTRLWTGVQTVMIGCIPAHALYFSTYEYVKSQTLDSKGHVTAYGSAAAGAAAVVAHDIIMGPLDTVKQRLQLGHYQNSLSQALRTMIQKEGWFSLYRSFPVTLASNVPYGMVMVGTNEFCKQQFSGEDNKLTLGVTLASSSVAGLLAAAVTTPLDRIKTYLQTQQLTPACHMSPAKMAAECPLNPEVQNIKAPLVANWKQAALRIYHTEGSVGFFRGMTPRILSHTPSVAISWTTYEFAKKAFLQHQS